MGAPLVTDRPTGGRLIGPAGISAALLESVVDIDVTYRRDVTLGLWFPSKMSELYQGPITRGAKNPFIGRATTRATYSDFKRFETGAQIKSR